MSRRGSGPPRIRHGGPPSSKASPVSTTDALFRLLIVDGRPSIVGECDIAAAKAIEAWLGAFGGDHVEVDLSGVTFFDAAALRALMNVRRRNPHIRVVQPSKIVARVLQITGTYDWLVDRTQ